MKPYPLVDDLRRRVLRVALPRAARSAAFLTRYLPARGRRRIIPRPPQIQCLGACDVSGGFFAGQTDVTWATTAWSEYPIFMQRGCAGSL